MQSRMGFMSSPSDSSDNAELVPRIRSGDISAFETLFKEYTPRLCDFAFRILQSREDAQDVVQETFLKIWKNRSELVVRGSLADYLYVAVRNTARNRLSHRQVEQRWRDRTVTSEEIPDTIQQHLESAEQSAIISRALGELPERQRAVCTLRWMYGLKYAEIAQRLGISEKTVENQLNRALKEIKDKLGGGSGG